MFASALVGRTSHWFNHMSRKRRPFQALETHNCAAKHLHVKTLMVFLSDDWSPSHSQFPALRFVPEVEAHPALLIVLSFWLPGFGRSFAR